MDPSIAVYVGLDECFVPQFLFLRFFAFILLIFSPMSLHRLSYCLQLHAEYRITGVEQTPACLNVAFNLEPD